MSNRTSAWLAWSLAALAVGMFVAGSALTVLSLSGASGTQPPANYGIADPVGELVTFLPFLAFPLVGALIASKRPENPIGWILLADGLLWMLLGVTDSYSVYGAVRPGTVPFPVTVGALGNTWLWVPTVGLLGIYLILLFPDGRLPSRRWRPLAVLSGLVIALLSVTEGLAPGPLENQGGAANPFGIEALPWLVVVGYIVAPMLPLCIFGSAVGMVLRYRRSRGEVREQIKWIAFAASFAGLVYLVAMIVGLILTLLAPGDRPLSSPLWLDLLISVAILGFAGVPVAMGFAVLKYRLYDIDIIINRTLVYGALTATVVVLYVLIVGALGAVFRARGDFGVSLVAAGVVAVVFAPLRERFQRGVNRLMYGERDDPYAVLTRLGKRLEATIAPEATLTTIVETIAQALKVSYVAIEFGRDGKGEYVTVVEHGSPEDEPVVLPLVYQRENIGRLVVAPRAPGEAFSPADTRLLEDLARQVEVAVHAYRLTADLRRSRERLVTTREEERRRLRRDLHDGLGPTLGALTLGLGTTRLALAQDDPKAVDALLLELKAQTKEAVSDVRRLVYGLRPPALDDLGLIPAIRQQAANRGVLAEELPNGKAAQSVGKNELIFRVESSDDLPPLPAAAEVACYRIAQEAITNAARHSGAGTCRLSLSVDAAAGTLELEVADDGTGISGDRRAGVGMSSMRERAEELGGTLTVGALPEGGTRVLATLPLPATGGEE